MPTYVIGDIQGCHDELLKLLDKLQFNESEDTLWFTGDLVNRGPRSLDVLRFVRDLGERAVTVLGNHDLHLLAAACDERQRRPKDTFDDVLNAPDRDALVDWLRHRPLLHHDAHTGVTLIHAGLPPQWDHGTAVRCAREVEHVLRSDDYTDFLDIMYGDLPDLWSEELAGHDRLRFITNCLTRLRYCNPEGRLVLQCKGPPGSQPEGCLPWFAVPGRATAGNPVLFGHWSTLGFRVQHDICALDSGCLWGGRLSAVCLEGNDPVNYRRVSVACPGARTPGQD